MTGLMRLVPRQAQWSIRSASYASASSSISSASAIATSSRLSLSSSQTRRAMHASPALDPVDPAASSTMDGAATQAQVASEETLDSAVAAIAAQQDANFVHVKMSYLHPSTKDPAKTPRLGDLKLGRIRAEPHFVPLSSYVFAMQPRRDVLHSAVVYYLDGLRQGTASTKTRGEVAFSGRKLMPQKGTGKARRGTRGSPLLRKGGVAHGPKPRDFSTRLNRRVREMALRSALSLRWQTGNLHIVKNFFWQAPPQSCRPLNLLLKTKGWDDALFLTAPRSPQPGQGMGRTGKPSAVDPVYAQDVIDAHSLDIQNFAIACANIPRTEIVKLNDLTTELHENPKKPNDRKRPGELHAYEVLARRKLICDLGAVEWLEEKLGGALFHEDELSLSSLSFDDVEGNTSAGTTIPVEEIAEEEIQAEAEVESQEDQNLNAAEDKAIREETDRVLKDVPADK